MITQCVLILRAREHRPRRRAPVRPHSANLEKMGARMECLPLRGRTRRPRHPMSGLEIAATVAGNLNVPFRVRRFWVIRKDGFENGRLATAGAGGKTLTRRLQSAIAGLLYRRSGCRAGQHENAGAFSFLAAGGGAIESRGRSNGIPWRQFVRAWCDPRARRNGACR